MPTLSSFTLGSGDKLVLTGKGGMELTLPSTMKATIIPKGVVAAKGTTSAAATTAPAVASGGMLSTLGGLFSLKSGVIASAAATVTAAPLITLSVAAATGAAVWKATELKRQETPKKRKWL